MIPKSNSREKTTNEVKSSQSNHVPERYCKPHLTISIQTPTKEGRAIVHEILAGRNNQVEFKLKVNLLWWL